MLPIPELKPFCELRVDLAPIMEMGPGRAGKRRIIPIIGGTVSGRVTGKILNLGADWQTIYADGSADLDTRYAFETDDGALIEIINKGVRHGPPDVVARLAQGEDVDPSEYYMRTTARLETGDPRYDWVNNMLFVGAGGRFASQVHVQLYTVE
jgi:Protein of unknown function (DUF3237)